MRHSLRFPPAVLLVTACALWGAATVLNKALLASINPVTLLVVQLAPSALFLWAAVLITACPAPATSYWLPLIALGVLNPGISYTLNLMGLASVSASVSTLLWAAEPLMILGLAALFLGEKITWRLLLVMLLGGLGVALVANVHGGLDAIAPQGVVLLLGAVLCCAFYTVFSRQLVESVDPVFTVALQQTAGLAWAVALLLVGTPFGSVDDIRAIPPATLVAAAISGLLYYAAAYWLYIAALRWVPAAVAGSYFNVIPIFGVGLAYLFLGETLTPVQWLGAGAILASTYARVRLTNGMGSGRSAE